VEHRRLGNQSIVIVGGTSGIGRSAAVACAAEGAGLVLIGRTEGECESAASAVAKLGAKVGWIAGDASQPVTVVKAVNLAVQRFGRLNGLFHVAGGSGRRAGDGPLDQVTDEGWQYTLRQNLDSLFYSNRTAVRQLLKQGTGGSILNVGSVLASSPSPTWFATHSYAAAKAGAIGLTKTAASYYAPHNIRINLLAPGLIDTPMAQRALQDEATMRYIRSKQPLDGGRAGQPSDLDQAVVYFLSDESRFVTGQVLEIDGGWSVSEGDSSQ
jgi:NAD(P)-dependent dehydrogenase (short-subunit alcohol dehydrogenase family)